jgi:tRNA(adenine34) deaminase
MIFDDAYFMKEALKEAEKAYAAGEVPVGAVLVHDNKIVARAHNQTELLSDVTAHAEILLITSAAASMGTKYFEGFSLYVTLEPCVMCAGAIRWARLGCIVYGASDEKAGYSMYSPDILHPKTKVSSGVEKDACAEILKNFFREKREI